MILMWHIENRPFWGFDVINITGGYVGTKNGLGVSKPFL